MYAVILPDYCPRVSDAHVYDWDCGTLRSFLSITLALMFFSFANDEGAVPFDQFSTGFSILSGGSKSEKLSAGFRLFDDDEDGALNRKQVLVRCVFVFGLHICCYLPSRGPIPRDVAFFCSLIRSFMYSTRHMAVKYLILLQNCYGVLTEDTLK